MNLGDALQKHISWSSPLSRLVNVKEYLLLFTFIWVPSTVGLDGILTSISELYIFYLREGCIYSIIIHTATCIANKQWLNYLLGLAFAPTLNKCHLFVKVGHGCLPRQFCPCQKRKSYRHSE